MNSKRLKAGLLLACLSPLVLGSRGGAQASPAEEAPPPATVVPDVDITLFSVEHPEQFPLATATEHSTTAELVVTGTVNPTYPQR